MLRSMMWTPQGGDKAFIAMMQDFVKTYMNRNASTEGFAEIGTTVPKYKFEPAVTAAPDGKWLLKATLTQSEVEDNFTMLVPVYADFDGQIARLGQVRITGNVVNDKIQVLLPKKPRKVMINAFHDVLEM